MTHPSLTERLARLAPDQRAAATMPPGPVLCVAPAGSGKTTTLVARIAWLVDRGTDPATIAALTFNRRAAEELKGRLGAALEPLGVAPGGVRVRTFHALGREILRDAGVTVDRLVDRADLLREIAPGLSTPTLARLDTAFSRLKLDLRAVLRARPVTRRPGRSSRPGSRTSRPSRTAARSTSTTSSDARWNTSSDRPACSIDGGRPAATCSSTRLRTSTAPSSTWRSSSPRRTTGSS
jgi:superfamily I DNA/RNA helicase